MKCLKVKRTEHRSPRKGWMISSKVLLTSLAVIVMFGMMGCAYGHAAFSQDLLINGDAMVRPEIDIRNTEVKMISSTSGAGEGYGSEYDVDKASMYPQIPSTNGTVTYQVKTCNFHPSVSYELVKLDPSVSSLKGMSYDTAGLTVGTNLVLGTVVKPGDCVTLDVEFKQGSASSNIASLTLDYGWTPYNGTPFDSKYMQDLTDAECAKTSLREVALMTDKRDNKKYWVGKLKDGKCWMTQNLAYDGAGKQFTAANASSWVSNLYTNDPQYYSTGDNAKEHGSEGNYYSQAAIRDLNNPVCPKGWRLPTEADYNTLHSGLGSASTIYNNYLSKAPFYYRESGWVDNRGVVDLGGGFGYFRVSDIANVGHTRVIYYGPSSFQWTNDNFSWGSSIRCLADENHPDIHPTTLVDIDNMQDMTAQICEDSLLGDTKQLIDTRDNHKYWVTKLRDNKCWMTQNLDYNGGGKRVFYNSLSSDWDVNDTTVEQYHYGNDNSAGHDSDGSWYSWNSAQKVCPAGWRPPTGDTTGEFYHLAQLMPVANQLTASSIQDPPYYFRADGWIGKAGSITTVGLHEAGQYVGVWSSTPRNGNNNSFHVDDYINSPNSLQFGTGSSLNWLGYNVRCLYDGS